MRQLKISKQITNRDSLSLNKYLTEVSNIPLLSPAEEYELARKIKEGDKVALEKLIKANLRFVISVAKQFNNQAPLTDLIQEGNIGLAKAAERFDETRGFKFISYAVWWIRQTILQYLAENGRQIRLPLNKIGILNRINQAKSELEQILQRKATYEEISDYLVEQEIGKGSHTSGLKNGQIKGDPGKFDEVKIKELLMNSSKISSLDAPMTSDSESGCLIDLIEGDNEHDVNRLIKDKDLQVELKRIFVNLKAREQEVLTLYYGLFDTTPMSLEEIGGRFELTRERVRQIKEHGLRRLKFRVSRTMLKEYR